ncbi:4-hydroxythreonine-4-phosphate dehydrogenase PdxA [Alphaproteobacteria bacterium]|nr:4-hydroxythreonine-4-phosphate dehydrogenase PdxA [Alphaproteobacteria bacterium]
MTSTKKFILLSAGDPSSISSEITIKAIQSSEINRNIMPLVVTDPQIIKDYGEINKSNLDVNEVKDELYFSDYKDNKINVIPIKVFEKPVLGKPTVKNAPFIKNSILKCVNIQMASIASAIVTNPIHKKTMYDSGFNFGGHTEFLASLSVKKKQPVMMLVGENLKTIPLTIHVPLKKVSNLITQELIIFTINTAKEYLISYFGISKPTIIVTGLNPHAGEDGDIGVEEENTIIPAINKALDNKTYYLSGPVSADTAFSYNKRKEYDLAICMYHDQALIPIKTLDFFNGVNVTLGLDFIRTSPDHGTGFDIAGKNKANPQSLIAAINLGYLMSINKDNEK